MGFAFKYYRSQERFTRVPPFLFLTPRLHKECLLGVLEYVSLCILPVLQVKALAAHPYGCRVVQRILEHCDEPQRFRILDELMASPHVLDDLVRDQYGNYVVQHVIQYSRPADRATVLARVKRDLFVFAQHKFASNVVEKCLQFGGAANRTAMVDELLSGEGGPQSQLMVLIRDQYANYVVQKVRDGLKEEKGLYN